MAHDRRTFLTRTGKTMLAAFAALGLDDSLLTGPAAAHAQTGSPSTRTTDKAAANGSTALVIDTDPGVDDASALVWLLSQRQYAYELLGICTVAGNTSLENATRNVLTVLDTVAPTRNVPVLMGAEQPLNGELSSIPKLIHGRDGLWGAQKPLPIRGVQKNVPAFYHRLSQSRPGFTVVALGPLTNLAQTLQRFPRTAEGIGRIVWLGGAKCGGNQTAVTEFNAWQDPEAAEIVLRSGIPITMLPLDTFTDFAITPEEVNLLERSSNRGGRFLVQPLRGLLAAFDQLTGVERANLPDVVAMMVALDPTLATTQEALVKIITDDCLARGQTIVGLSFIERLTLIATDAELSAIVDRYPNDMQRVVNEFFAIYSREPANVAWVSAIDVDGVRDRFFRALT
ncbi:MAG TPA: nucleoside hydrolase [Herpetosiphonaceae bacterium]